MKSAIKYVLVGISGAALFISGVAWGQAQERYFTARDAVERATTLLMAIGPLNGAEARQRDRALDTLAKAHDQITCAQLRSTDRRAACP